MKKFFFSILFAIGFFAMSQAQTLFYQVENQSAYAWEFKIGDGNGNGNYHPFFFGTQNGGWNGFGFNLEFGGSNTLGCSAYQNIGAAPSIGPVPFPCFVPTAMNYSFVQINPLLYFLYVEIS